MWFYRFIVFLLLSACSNLQAEKLPIEYFSRLPLVETPKLSPNGDKILALFNIKNKSVIGSRAIDGGKITSLYDVDNTKHQFESFFWLNNEYTSARIWTTSRVHGHVLWNTRMLYRHAEAETEIGLLLEKGRIIDFMGGDDNYILAQRYSEDKDGLRDNGKSVFRHKIGKKSRATRIKKFRPYARSWATDENYKVRAYIAYPPFQNAHYTIYVNDESGGDWRPVTSFKPLSEDSVSLLKFEASTNRLYARVYHNGFKAIAYYDLNKKDPQPEIVYAEDGIDVDGELLISPKTKRILGVRTNNADGGYIIWDENTSKLVRGIDKAFPNKTNTFLGFSHDMQRYIFRSESSDSPPVYFFGDREAKSVAPIAFQYPELSKHDLPAKNAFDFETNDGLTIRAYVTLPVEYSFDDVIDNDAKVSLPTIVLPHGGPISNTYLGFDYWVHFFANRGYAVLEIDFRGSSGYGYDFMQAGFENWGQQMQDDLRDGFQWLVDRGISDKSRACIVGASYGGYAALMGLAKTPETYQCAISFAGVTDLSMMARYYKDTNYWRAFKIQLGDDYDLLTANSPTTLVKDITKPVLLLHGENDVIVRVKQSRKLAKLLSKYDKKYEFLEVKNVGHGLSEQAARHQVFRAMDKFLAKHLPVER